MTGFAVGVFIPQVVGSLALCSGPDLDVMTWYQCVAEFDAAHIVRANEVVLDEVRG